ncbi:type II toxin-antitoxin system HicB family antitoxin [Nitratidesulfovibrio vulgaris]|uniref:HicB-like antitoxin of toxin-antitoxin system domain-containing protein n=1 Tax=Nitratidesulfovibrio vulgaris (strain ATCC 29579 / DSM 644 / CCUG 34227 / NCIMB 8303 / VKM B-1760 / Hildenborough) TaxID=882 RepID=Q72FI9_NITV2|nr:type II toxin-antitoxin system HicB family antitoxin [Nitratidesulfovibrio vulgaris]AAS94708.1 conserved hypothetical protein [Nitratidesulfovibrio vulgaris str. Hildenborough]
MRYPLLVSKDAGSSYGGILPDFPGCYPMGETLDELLDNVQDAVETWMLGEDPEIFPQPSRLEDVQRLEEADGKVLLLVEVNPDFLDSTPQRINITVPRYALGLIDKAAKASGSTRSAYLVSSALERVQPRG